MEMYLDLSIVCIDAVLAGKTRENRAEIIRIGFSLNECHSWIFYTWNIVYPLPQYGKNEITKNVHIFQIKYFL